MGDYLRYVARVVIQFKTPFIIASGESDDYSDALFVTDANGLPALPGSSIAGVLRSHFRRLRPDREKILFGYQGHENGEGSRLIVSWGCIHDSNNRPVEGLLSQRDINIDEVLQFSLASVIRDHVRIGHRGTAETEGKFDERNVAAGHRFTFEIILEGGDTEQDREDWNTLLAILVSPDMRFGGKTRRGYGAFEVISLKEGVFDLTDEKQFEGFLAHPVELSGNTMLRDKLAEIKASPYISTLKVTLELRAEGFWLIGGGPDHEADITPLMESRITWDNDRGRVSDEEILVPGTAIKGPLSHRIAYHYNRLNGIYSDRLNPEEVCQHVGSNNKAVAELFGYAKDDKNGLPGRLFIDDIFIGRPDTKFLNHIAIDQYTGGTFQGALFSEKPEHNSCFPLGISISDADDIPINVRRAFLSALTELASGILPIGSGAGGRGNGFFFATKDIQWSDDGQWIEEGK